MTMYLPNDHIRPVGAEIAEFVDVPPMRRDVTPRDEAEETTTANDQPSS